LPAAIVTLAVFLRLYQLEEESLWADEAASVRFARMDVVELWRATIDQDNTPPLYYLFLHLLLPLLGDSEVSLRLPAALAGIGAVAVVYRLGEMLFGMATGAIAALMLTVSPFHLEYSQEVRVYEPLALVSALSFLFFARILLAGERGAMTLWGYVLSTLLMLYAHHYGLFGLLAQGVVFLALLLSGWATLHWWWRPFGLVAAGYAPGLALLYHQFFGAESGSSRSWLWEPSFADLPTYVAIHAGSYAMAVLLLLLALLATASLILSKTREARIKVALLWSWMLFPILVPFAISKLTIPILFPRYTIAASIPLFLLAARGVTVVADRLPLVRLRPAVAALVVVLLCLPVLPEVKEYYTETKKPPWRDLAANLDAQPGDLVYVEPGWELHALEYYYRGEGERFGYGITVPEDENYGTFENALPNRQRVWLVLAAVKGEEAREALVSSGYSPIEERQYEFESSPERLRGSLQLTLWERSG
jgi:mannosyltransferase